MRCSHFHRCLQLAVSACTLAGGAALVAATPGVNLEELPPFEKVAPNNSQMRHAGQRDPVTVAWRAAGNVQNVLAVYPHPVAASRVVVATAKGLLLSDDYGQTWNDLPGAAFERVGAINQVVFSRRDADTFYVASKTKGLWMTRDGGQSFSQIGSRKSGLASDSVLSMELSSYDPQKRTLLVCHGDAAPGLSRSLDGGKTWSVLFPEQHFHRIYTESEQGIFIVAAPVAEPDSLRLCITPSLGDAWQEMARDIVCNGFASPLVRDDYVLVATADRGLLRITREGGVVRELKPAGVSEWSSVGATWGAHQDAELVYAFEPTRLGLVLMDPQSLTPEGGGAAEIKFRTASEGLLRSSVVREGAHVRANAPGTHFYAAINSLLYIGRRSQGPQTIQQLEITSPIRRYDAQVEQQAIADANAAMRTFVNGPDVTAGAAALLKSLAGTDDSLSRRYLILTATVDVAAGAPAVVSADLGRVGFGRRVPLTAIGNGRYQLRFPLDPQRAGWNPQDWHRHWPGSMAFTVTAVSDSGQLSSAVAPFVISDLTAICLPAFHGVRPEKGQAVALNDQPLGRKRRNIKGFASDPAGPWRVALQHWSREYDVSSYYALAMFIRTREPSTQDLYVQLRDQPAYDYPHTTPPLGLLKSGLVPEGRFTGELQRVVIPLSQLLGSESEFQPSTYNCVLLSGDGGKRVEYFLDQVQFYPTPESLGLEDAE